MAVIVGYQPTSIAFLEHLRKWINLTFTTSFCSTSFLMNCEKKKCGKELEGGISSGIKHY